MNPASLYHFNIKLFTLSNGHSPFSIADAWLEILLSRTRTVWIAFFGRLVARDTMVFNYKVYLFDIIATSFGSRFASAEPDMSAPFTLIFVYPH